MAINISFNNPNQTAVTIKIYRGAVPLDRKNLANPIATLDNVTDRSVNYVDTTVVQDAVYYYVFETIGTKDRDISQNMRIQASKDRGPGNNVLQLGSYTLGYFDTIIIDQLISVPELIALTGISGLTSLAPTYLIKSIVNGVTVFTPNKPVAVGNVSWNALNSVGMVDGTKHFTSVNKEYSISLMHGLSDNPDIDLTGKTFPFDADAAYPGVGCDFTRLVYPLALYTPSNQQLPNLMNQTNADLGLTTTRKIICRDLNSVDGNVIYRGSNAAGRAGLTAVSTDTKASVNAGNTMWWPIISLLEQ